MNADGSWLKKESAADYQQLVQSFATPREAVDFIMESFAVLKGKDIKAFDRFKTKDEDLEAYDALMAAADAQQLAGAD